MEDKLLNQKCTTLNITNQKSLFKTAEVIGYVTSIKFGQRGDPINFRIHCPNSKKTYNAVCSLFCPIRENDTIYALCNIGLDGILYVMREPFVQPAIDRDSVIQCFMRSMRKGYGTIIKLYNDISKIAGGDDSVIPFLSGIAQSWNDTRNSDILFMFNGAEPDDVKKLLVWWHKERNLRRLYLFGLTKKEINSCRMTCDDIYNSCIKNPYTIPAIPLEKCDSILKRLNKVPDTNDRIRGSIIRIIWKNLNENGWTGTPTKLLHRQFPDIKQHVDALKSNYELVAEMETAYLKFPHKVETFIADYIINKRNEDYINYDTPLDQIIHINDNKIIQRHSAHFTRQLSTDQQTAIQGALDHTICVITGGGGTGKCLKLGTKILMFDGSIKKIEDIKENELIMGPDSKPRKILSKCYGTDEMFEIIPSMGKSFTCNSCHILTLIGPKPQYFRKSFLGNNDKYGISYSQKGNLLINEFDTYNEAINFKKSLPEDIFDVPLNEYLTWHKDKRRLCHLFRVSINFPNRQVPFSPIIMGKLVRKYLNGSPNIKWEKYNIKIPSIPIDFRVNSTTIRMEVLNKIFLGMNKHQCLNNNYKCQIDPGQLCDDIQYLALSLGYIVTYKNCILQIFRSDIWKYGVNNSDIQKFSFKVKSVGKGIYCGFELNGDGRFLLEDFLVTHNTTCIAEIVHNLELRGIAYAICSFTGKAVARIREVTKKRNPATMHRLIANTKKNRLDEKYNEFDKDNSWSNFEHIIIDETSMVTTELLYDFIQAYPNIKHLTLVGDVNQLPPIGWGNLFSQLLRSETIPVYKLITNHRVYTIDGERDGIILNANAIVSHDPLYPFEYVQTNNFSLIEGPIERVYDIIKGCFAGGVKSDQIAIVTPYNKSLNALNTTFQNIYNSDSRSVTDSRNIKWAIGDRVMLTENDQNIGVYNGESGTILDITSKAILVDFGNSGCHEFLLEPTHEYKTNYEQGTSYRYYYKGNKTDGVLEGEEEDTDDERTVKKLVHSFALTIDKSQGSEWDFVIVYIAEFNIGSFLNKNRIYTALTRAKRCCWVVVTDIESFNLVSVKSSPFRCENLHRRLSAKLPNIKPYVVSPPIPSLEMINEYPNIPEEYFDNGIDCDDF